MNRNTIRSYWRVVALALGGSACLVTTGCLDHGVTINGTGASFPAPLYARWIALFQRDHKHIHVHYLPVGSGGGIRAITAREADFGASDAPLTESETKKLPGKLLTIPTCMGPVVLAYNLPGVREKITLDADTVAGIYLGEITSWRDPRIRELNPGVKLPDLKIRPAHRSDSSGTTFIFTSYLSAISETWEEEIGAGKTVPWPFEGEWEGDGNDGVAHRILLLPGGIGYLEMRYAQNAGLDHAILVNRDGYPVRATVEGVQSAEQNTLPLPGSLAKPSMVNARGRDSYPICGYTYLLVYEDITYMEDPEREAALITFLEWALTEGQEKATDLHYVPLPEPVRRKALDLVRGIRTNEREGGVSSHGAETDGHQHRQSGTAGE